MITSGSDFDLCNRDSSFSFFSFYVQRSQMKLLVLK